MRTPFLVIFILTPFSDPPENIEISDPSITLAEGKKSEKILCTAEAYPEANYEWHFNEEARNLPQIFNKFSNLILFNYNG